MTDNDALVCELLPCPVCGDKPKWRGSRHDYAAGIYRLQCLGETHLFQAYGASEEKCIAAWNARPPLTPQAKPLDLLAQDEVEVVAREIHEHLSRRDIMQYLDNDEDCRGLATAAIAALDRHRGTDALREENARLRAVVDALAVLMPIQVEAGRDYAEVFFADGTTHSTQAMTMNPQHWRDLADAYARAALTGRQG